MNELATSNHAHQDSDQSGIRTLHVGAPNLGDRAVFDKLVDEMFERRWFTNGGELVKRFETTLADYLEVKHCITVCNATTGLQLAAHALGLQGEVIVPAFTFVATPHSVSWDGLTPVFADVDPATHTIDSSQIESLITDRTSAIIGVHLWGNVCDVDKLHDIAIQHDLALIFDAAHAFGCKSSGVMVGNHGNCEVFSFHATKFFNTFEGGAITTNDDVLAEKLRLMKNFGFAGMDRVVHLGTNAKMMEICAAMGIAGFDGIRQTMDHNLANHHRYRRHLASVDGLKLLSFGQLEQSNWQYVVVEIDEQAFGRSRDSLMHHLHDHGVRARRYFYPGCHKMEPYRSRPGLLTTDLSTTEALCQKVICLPTGNAISGEDIARVCGLISDAARSTSRSQHRAAG